MITFEEYKNTDWYDAVDYANVKKYYLNEEGRKIQKLCKLFDDNKDILEVACCWVTDFGTIDGGETDDDDLISIFTYCGNNHNLAYIPCVDIGFKKEVNDADDTDIHKSLRQILGDDFYSYTTFNFSSVKRELGWYRLESGDVNEYYGKIYDAIAYIRAYTKAQINNKTEKKDMTETKKYMWVASSNDGSFEDRSKGYFTSKRACYEDMRKSALEKMEWNTNYDEDFEGAWDEKHENFIPNENDDNQIGYKVQFHPNYIIHESYSGVYTYKIVEYKVDSAPRLIIDGLFEGKSEEEVKTLEDNLMTEIRNTLARFATQHEEEVKSLKIADVQHICLH